jgi:hypothetical protein
METLNYAEPAPATASKGMLWAGRVISALPVLMIVGGGIYGLTHLDMVKEQMRGFGYPENVALPLCAIEIACAILYAIPQTAVLGAILLTGYLGGAVATHVMKSQTAEMFMPVIVAVIVWLGIFLRDARLRALVPFRSLPAARPR